MNKIRNILVVLAIYILVAFHFSNVEASTASISANKTNVAVGETVTVTVSVTGAAWNIHITGSVTGSFADSSENGENTSFTKQFTFTPSAPGNYTVTLSGDTTEGSTNETSPVSGSVTIVATENATTPTAAPTTTTQPQPEQPKKSNNATLSNLGITPNDFKGFTPNKTSYSTTVPNSVSSVNIYANPAKGQENKQKIEGAGKKNLQEGVNQFSIVVTAEDGTTKKTYNLSITREAAKEEENKEEENTTDTNIVEEDKEKEEDDDEPKIGLSKLTIEGITLSPEFKKDVYEYTAKLIGEKTSLDVKTTAIDEGQIIEVVGNEDLKEGENIITIMVKSADEKETVTYQITVNKSLVDEEAIAREKAEEEMQKQKRQQRLIIIGVIVGAIVIVGGILLVRYIRYRKGTFDDYEDDENDDDFENELETKEEFDDDSETKEDLEEFENKSDVQEETDETDDYNQEKEESQEYDDEMIEEKLHRRRSKGKRFKD